MVHGKLCTNSFDHSYNDGVRINVWAVISH